MKYISKWYIACLAMAFCCLVSACSDEEEQLPVEVSFIAPAPESFDIASLDSCESIMNSFELTSNGAWRLYSNKMWVKLSLSPDGEFYNDIQGAEGTHTVYIKVTNDARLFSKSQATVKLIAGNKVKDVVTIERGGKKRAFALLTSEGEELENIDFGTGTSATVVVDANFDCSILSLPAWMGEPEAASGAFSLNVAKDSIPFPNTGVAVFGTADSSVVYEVPVVYSGMAPDVVDINGEYSAWGWVVSLDGKEFTQSGTTSMTETTVVKDALMFSVACLNYDYKLVPIQIYDGKLMLMDSRSTWILSSKSKEDPSQVKVTVRALSEGYRAGYLFAVPSALYSDFISSCQASRDAQTFIDENSSYIMFEVEQKDPSLYGGFIVTDANEETVEVVQEKEKYDWLSSELNVTDITACKLVPGQSYTINTKLSSTEWDGAFKLTNLEYNAEDVENWGTPVAKLGADGIYQLNITVPESLNEAIILRLYNGMNINVKVLVIRPVNQ